MLPFFMCEILTIKLNAAQVISVICITKGNNETWIGNEGQKSEQRTSAKTWYINLNV